MSVIFSGKHKPQAFSPPQWKFHGKLIQPKESNIFISERHLSGLPSPHAGAMNRVINKSKKAKEGCKIRTGKERETGESEQLRGLSIYGEKE